MSFRSIRFPAPSNAVFAVALLVAGVAFADDPIKPEIAPARGKEVLVIKESKDAQVFNAEGQDVTVNGDHNQVSIKGTCHALTVSGSNNVINVAAVASISLSGRGNEVVWSTASGGEKPQVTDLGKNNQVSHSAVKAD